MPKSNATVTATSAASNVAQTVTLSKGTGVSSINIAGTNYTSASVSLNCGTYNISGNYAANYEFDSWSRANNVTVASTSSASTTMTVSGAGTLTLNAKASCKTFSGYMQDISTTSQYCAGATGTLVDKRDSRSYTVAKIGNTIWMTKNLDLPGGTTLTAADSNVTSNYTLPASSNSGRSFSNNDLAYVYNSNSTTCRSGSPCYSYYSYVAATAGTNPRSGEATSDICPKGWRLPTNAELTALINTYTTGDALTAAPFYGVYAGYYYYDNVYSNYPSHGYGGQNGNYWSSYAGTSNATHLHFYSSYATTAGDEKCIGFSVRCVAK